MKYDYIVLIQYLSLLIVWGFLFFNSYKFKIKPPWSFVFILLWMLFPNQGFSYKQNGVIYFGISISFLIALTGMLLNISETKTLLSVKDFQKTSYYTLIGILYVFIVLYITKPYQETEYLLNNTKATLIAIIFLGVQASLEEEVLFRGFLINYLRSYSISPITANLFQSLIFMLLHARKYINTPFLLIEVFILGLLAGYFTWRSRSLIPASVMHILVNILPFIL